MVLPCISTTASQSNNNPRIVSFGRDPAELSPTLNWPTEGSNPKAGVISTRLYPTKLISHELFMAKGQMSRGAPQTWGSGNSKDFPEAASWSSAVRELPREMNPTSLPLTLIALKEEGDALRRRMLFFLPAEQE